MWHGPPAYRFLPNAFPFQIPLRKHLFMVIIFEHLSADQTASTAEGVLTDSPLHHPLADGR